MNCKDMKNNLKVVHRAQKNLKIVNKPQGKGYTPGINLQGLIFSKIGFVLGDMVKVSFSFQRIVIELDRGGQRA